MDVEDVLDSVVSGRSSVVGAHVVLPVASSSLEPVSPASVSTLESVVPIGGEESAGTHADAYVQAIITAAATVERHGQEWARILSPCGQVSALLKRGNRSILKAIKPASTRA